MDLKRSFSYRTYYYLQTGPLVGCGHHFLVYYPQRPKYVYSNDPVKKHYCGRYYALKTEGPAFFPCSPRRPARGAWTRFRNRPIPIP
jgi:hypothetical protein